MSVAKDLEKILESLQNAKDMLEDVKSRLESTTAPDTAPVEEEVAGNVIVVSIDDEDKEYNLDTMNLKQLKALVKDFGLTTTAKSKSEIIQAIMEWYTSEDGESEEGESEEEEGLSAEEQIIADYKLDELSVTELKEILDQAELSTKGRKESLIQRVVDAIIAGDIELQDEDEEESDGESGEVEGTEEATNNVSVDNTEAEAEIEKEIRGKIQKGKLKLPAIKSFLKSYYNGDPDCSDCSGCKEAEIVDCYIEIHKSLVDDDGNSSPMQEPYVRGGEDYCCGKPIKVIDGKLFCEVCGSEYE